MSGMRAFRSVLASVVILAVLRAVPVYPWHGTGIITALAIDPQRPTTLYAGTCDRGVFKSTDGGTTWTATGLTNIYVFALAIDPQTPTTLYAGAAANDCTGAAISGTYEAGVFKSTDGGASWSPTGLTAASVFALAINHQTPTTLHAMRYDTVFKSTDGGTSWSSIGCPTDDPATPTCQALAIDPLTPTTLSVGVGYSSPEMEWGSVLVSTDGGASWGPTYTSYNTLLDSVRALAIDPLTPTTLYAVGSYGAYKSTDGGASWSPTGLPETVASAYFGASVYSLAIDPRTPTTLYAGTTSGVHKSTDEGASWSAVNNGLTNMLLAYGVGPGVGTLAIDPVTPTMLYAGTSIGVFKSTDGGAYWNPTGLFQHSPLSSVSLSPTSVTGGSAATGAVTLITAAPAGGAVVTLSSSNYSSSDLAAATVPATVTVPEGATSATFTVSTNSVSVSTGVTISAAFDDATRSAAGLVYVPTTPNYIFLSPTSVIGGTTSTGFNYVALGAPAPAGGAVVTLSSSNTSVATVPASVTVPAGAWEANFTVSTSPVAVSTAVTISGTYADVTRSAVLTVTPPPTAVASVSLNPTSVTGGIPSYGTVTLNGAAPAGNAAVTFSSSNPWVATVPVSSQVPAGYTSTTFTVGTKPVTASTAVTISASFNGVTKSAVLTVTPPPATLSSVSLNPTSVTGGTPSTGTVSLSAAAPAEGAAVTLSSSNPAVATVPASVTVPAGATSANFTVSTAPCASAAVTISGTYGGVTRFAGLTVTTTPDIVAIQTAEYFARRQVLRAEATSTGSTATLSVFESSSGKFIGTLTKYDGGKYRGQFTWPVNPQNITVRSSLCGWATSGVMLK